MNTPQIEPAPPLWLVIVLALAGLAFVAWRDHIERRRSTQTAARPDFGVRCGGCGTVIPVEPADLSSTVVCPCGWTNVAGRPELKVVRWTS